MLGTNRTYNGRSTRRHSHGNVGVEFEVPSTVAATRKLSLALRRLDSRSRNEFPNSDVIVLESNLNTGRSSKKCKLHHENDSSSEDPNTNTVTVVPCDSVSVSCVSEDKLEKKVPSPSRSIIENSGLSKLITDNMVCRTCKRVGTLSISFPSIGVNTIIVHTAASVIGRGNLPLRYHLSIDRRDTNQLLIMTQTSSSAPPSCQMVMGAVMHNVSYRSSAFQTQPQWGNPLFQT